VDLHPTGKNYSTVVDINDFNQVGSADQHAALWSGSPESYVDLHPAGAQYSIATAVSGRFQAGHATFGSGHAAFWEGTSASFVDLHSFLGAGFTHSEANGLYSDGNGVRVVGTATDASFGTHAVLWTISVPDAMLDSDGDGSSNLQEYVAGTNSQDGGDALGILTMETVGTDLQLGFKTVTGNVYRVDRSDVSPHGPWAQVGALVIGDGTLKSVADAGIATAPRRFYRVVIVP
jgi:hypothetical protein